jgi:hypothetical protein
MRVVRPDYARAERVVRLVVDALLDAHALDPYWLSIPCSQGDLKSSDFLRDGVVPQQVLERVQDALEVRG